MTLSYLGFHALLVLPPLALLLVTAGGLSRATVAGIVLLASIALVYTTPWDNYLIFRGTWSYAPEALALRFGFTPLGEYLFFVLQSVLTGLWFHRVLDVERIGTALTPSGHTRTAGVALWGAIAAVGGALVATAWGYYLGAILLWAAPIVALQWAVGGPALWAYRRGAAVAIGVPTLYLCFIDSVAIHHGIWIISSDLSTGLTLLGLPIEEAVFFLLTNVLVVQGLLLFHWVRRRVVVGGVAYGLEGLNPWA